MADLPRLIGMVHLGALPGAPLYRGDLTDVVASAVADARRLEEAGFDAVGVENFGDAPFYPDDVPKVTVAAMTRAVGAVAEAVGVPVGVNVLRNDAAAALAIAAATEAAFIRVNVLSGSMWTDQGPIVGRSADVARLRRDIAPGTRILADVFVKHATPPTGATIEQAAEDLVERGLADAIIVSGTSTGRPPTIDLVRTVAGTVPGTPVYVGSGAAASNVADFLTVAHGVIAGTTLKLDAVTTNPVDSDRAKAFVVAAAPPGV